jgi:hypothetical protein
MKDLSVIIIIIEKGYVVAGGREREKYIER